MRSLPSIPVALLAAFALAAPGVALEKSVERMAPGGPGGGGADDDWNASGWPCSCDIAYYNLCTGYIWVWSGWQAENVVGTVFDTCCDPASEWGVLTGAYFYYRTGAVPGYGFTGTTSIHDVDASSCPIDPPVASQPILPANGWNFSTWGIPVDSRFAIVHTIADDFGFGTPVTIATDGPLACGNCFPTTRTTRSFSWGTSASPLCPGSPMFDGNCQVEFLSEAVLGGGVAVESTRWGEIKALYR